MTKDHDHEEGHHHHLRESETYYAARTKALESLFREKGLIGIDTVDRVIRFFEHEMGPFNGAKGRRQGLDGQGLSRALDC